MSVDLTNTQRLDHVSIYTLFDIHAFTAANYAKFLPMLGETDSFVRNSKRLRDLTEQAITARNQWGRYHIYANDPLFYAHHADPDGH